MQLFRAVTFAFRKPCVANALHVLTRSDRRAPIPTLIFVLPSATEHLYLSCYSAPGFPNTTRRLRRAHAQTRSDPGPATLVPCCLGRRRDDRDGTEARRSRQAPLAPVPGREGVRPAAPQRLPRQP